MDRGGAESPTALSRDPRTIFLHYWGIGPAADLARTFKRALDAQQRASSAVMAKDPVCGMDVDVPDAPGGKSEYQGSTYYFCSGDCKNAFDADPARYATGS